MMRTMTAITSSRWIKLPPTWPSKPSSQSTSRMTNMVHSMGIPFWLNEILIGIYPEDYVFAKPFRNMFRIIVFPDVSQLGQPADRQAPGKRTREILSGAKFLREFPDCPQCEGPGARSMRWHLRHIPGRYPQRESNQNQQIA